MPYTDGQWQRFFQLAGEPAMASDPRYSTQSARSRHFTELYAFLDAILAQKSTAQWLALLAVADIPFAPVNSLDGLLDDPHLRALGFWRQVEHPTEGTLMQTGLPVHFSRTPAGVTRHAPSLGEHTDELLGGSAASGGKSKT